MPMENLRTIRNEKRLTQAQLAQKAGVDQGFISKIEKGEGNPSLENIRQIANALGVEIAEMFTLPDLKRRTLAAMEAITDPTRQEAAVVVLEAMARGAK